MSKILVSAVSLKGHANPMRRTTEECTSKSSAQPDRSSTVLKLEEPNGRSMRIKFFSKSFSVICSVAVLTFIPCVATAHASKPAHVIPTDGEYFGGKSAEELAKMVPPAAPKDVASPQALVTALHEAVNGPAGAWDKRRLLSLCLPHISLAFPETDSHGIIRISTVPLDDVVKEVLDLHKKNSWYEKVLVTHVTQQANIAVAYYSAEAGTTQNGKLLERGVNICEMIFDGKRWWIASDIWSDIGTAPWPADLDPQKNK